MMEKTKIIESLRTEISECDEYLKNEPEECLGFDEVCIIKETRKEMCEKFLCMLGEVP